jgi:hypothetical protein
MGALTNMLPQIEAKYQTRAILEYLGCARLGCTVTGQEDIVRFGRWVRHNKESKFFDDFIERQGGVPVQPDVREAPVAYIPTSIAAWVTGLHADIEARKEQERQAVIEADPWRQHAAMVSLDR